MRKYAAESIFAADLPHTSKRQKQSAADLRQKDSSRGSSKLVCGKYAAERLFKRQQLASLRQVCGRKTLKFFIHLEALKAVCGKYAAEKKGICKAYKK